MDTNFGMWLIEQMKEKQWTQSDLARASGLTRQAISYYLTDKSKSPDENALKKIAHALHLPAELIFEKAGLLPPKPELSPLRRAILHLSEDLPDSDLEMILGLLEQRTKYYEQHPQAKPAK